MKRALLFISIFLLPYIAECRSGQIHLHQGFTENKGQMNSDILYKASAKNLQIYVLNDGLYFDHKIIRDTTVKNIIRHRKSGHSYKMIFNDGSINKPSCRLENTVPVNYIYADKRFKTNKGDELIINNLYDGIDLKLYFENNELRYDFIVYPGADPSLISYHFEGADYTKLNNNKIIIGTALGEIEHRDLKIYQKSDNSQENIIGAIQYNGSYSFKINSYDTKKELIIDPVIFSTFLGGGNRDEILSSCRSANGGFFLTGSTMSDDFPVNTGAYDEEFNGVMDAFVCKLNSDGTQLIYATFIGGSSTDVGMYIVADNNDEVFVTGNTESEDFPVSTWAFDTEANGDYDIFVCKLTADGSDLIYSTYLGGTFYDECRQIYLSGGGNIIMGGKTYSEDFPVTSGVYDETFNGVQDIVVCKLNSDGSGLMYSTFIGGSNQEQCYGIAVDPYENIYLAGMTMSTDFPVTPGAYDLSFNGNGDAYICKLSDLGQTLELATYLGGSQNEYTNSIILDNNGDLIICGETNSFDFDVTADAFDNTHNGSQDVFISKFDTSLSSLIYSSFYGGDLDEEVNSINHDIENCYYVTGVTFSDNFPTTLGAYDREFDGTADAFVMKVKASGEPAYSTLLGGNNYDVGITAYAISCDEVIIAGNTDSEDFPVTDEVIDDEHNGLSDIFLARLSGFSRFFIEFEEISTSLCPGEAIELDFEVSSSLNSGNEFSVELSAPDGSFESPEIIGSRYGMTSGKIYMVIPKDIEPGENYRIRMKATDPEIVSEDNGSSIKIGLLPVPQINSGGFEICKNSIEVYYAEEHEGSYYRWEVEGGEISGANDNSFVEVQWGGTDNGKLYLYETLIESGCVDTLEQDISLLGKPSPELNGSLYACEGTMFYYYVNVQDGVITQWFAEGAQIVDSTDDNQVGIIWPEAGEYSLKIVQNRAGCRDSLVNMIIVVPPPEAYFEGPASCRPGDTISFSAISGENYKYRWIADGAFIIGSNTGKDIEMIRISPGVWDLILIVEDSLSGCRDTVSHEIAVLDSSAVYISGDDESCRYDTLSYSVYEQDGFLYEWSADGGRVIGVSNKYEADVYWEQAGDNKVILIRKIVKEDETIQPLDTNNLEVTVYELPETPYVTIRDTVLESSSESGNQWFLNGQILYGATEKQLIPEKNGYYSVILIDENRCSSDTSEPVLFDKLNVIETIDDKQIVVYPNPFENSINIRLIDDIFRIEVINSIGGCLYSSNQRISLPVYNLDLSFLAAGAYYLKISSQTQTKVFVIIKNNN